MSGFSAWGGGDNWATSNTIIYTTTGNTSGTGTGVYVPQGQGLVVMPATPVVEPEPDGPLDWLRRRVDEVCEEAFAA